jgi:serine phosphatase RsbU (regulator of sigma subunit)
MSAAEAARAAWRWLTRTLPGRLLLLGLIVKALVWTDRLGTSDVNALDGVDTLASVFLVIPAVVLGYRLYVVSKRVVLWRVRRKLTLSYVFIGFVPALLLIAFFSISGLLMFFNMGSYMLRTRVETLVERTLFLAQAAALEAAHAADVRELATALARHQETANARFDRVSYAVVPSSAACASGLPPAGGPLAVAGPWGHSPAPATMPDWVSCAGFANLVAGPVTASDAEPARVQTWVAARGIAWFTRAGQREAVIVDVPMGNALLAALETDTGVTVRSVRLFDHVAGPLEGGTSAGNAASGSKGQSRVITLGPANVALGAPQGSRLRWAAFLDYTDWASGQADTLFVEFGMGFRAVYNRISAFPVARLTEFSVAQLFLVVLAIVAVLFLIIITVAFLMGFVLARSITGAVHELFEGTERVRGGDFSHKIVVRSRDQLGQLAESFNSMTSSIEDLLRQKAQKERLEQELRIAREIQMSLLPQGPMTGGGVSFAGHCEPAREVGGDYYDFWAIDDHRFGMLIADVAGKGTSAALYMAELKGIVLSFSQSHMSPRQLLIDANRIISNHLDTRRFITMTYGVVDVRAGTLTYARAGHCPLIRLPGPSAASQSAEVLAPNGLVLGLKLDDGEMFERLLEEATLAISPGDLFLLYTDGLTEAMNPAGDFFGEDRLSAIVQAHGASPFTTLRDEILTSIATFVGPAEQQDDMTMLLLRVQHMDQAAA